MGGAPGGGSSSGGSPDAGPPTCLVAIDTPTGPWLGELPLAPGMRVADALAAARELSAGSPGLQAVDWQSDRVGVWGQRCGRARPVSAGDRVELYLPLPGDPRERRRARAGPARGPLRRPGR
jgi:putative ubiquitin-RnfH superfamily antitoxin RatB of RatAB toxin-antitoxin module